MEDLSRIEQKLDLIAKDVSDIKVNVAVNTTDLKHHIKRTDTLEAYVMSYGQRALTIISIVSALVILGKQLL